MGNENLRQGFLGKKIKQLVAKENKIPLGNLAFENLFNKITNIARDPRPSHIIPIKWDGDIDLKGACINDAYKDHFPYELTYIDSINGSLDISHNKINSFEGCPQIIKGNFIANDIETNTKSSKILLSDGPQHVGGNYDISNTKLQMESLVGSPSVINGDFTAQNCGIRNLIGCPDEVAGKFWVTLNGIVDFNHTPNKFKGFIINGISSGGIEFPGLASTRINWCGFKPDMTHQETANLVTECCKLYDPKTKNMVGMTNLLHSKKVCGTQDSQTLAAYLLIIQKYPNFLQDESLKALYNQILPKTLEEFDEDADVRKYDGVDDSMIRMLVRLLKR